MLSAISASAHLVTGQCAMPSAFEAGEFQHLFDEMLQMPAKADDVGHIVRSRSLELRRRCHFKQFGKADDAVERRAQFMAHMREELGFDLAGADCFIQRQLRGLHLRSEVMRHVEQCFLGLADLP